MNETIERTVSVGLCIGCGVCRAVCAPEALTMSRSDDGIGRPVVDASKCVHCGLCARICPQHPDRLSDLRTKLSALAHPEAAGVTGAKCYLAWADDRNGRQRSASGGVATGMALQLLRSGRIDGVVHVHRVAAGRGGAHYRAVLSRTEAEIEAGRGSAYETIDFSEALLALKSGERYFVTGTPCVIRGLKALIDGHPRFRKVEFLTCALVCSHNVSPRFADALADRLGVPSDAPFLVDFRDKLGITDAGKFKTRYYLTDGSDLYRENRGKSGWTKLWRSFAHAPLACRRCSDFWGLSADMSVKDAWGDKEWTSDPLGRSVVLFRNGELERTFLSGEMTARQLTEDAVARMQLPQSLLKQAGMQLKKCPVKDRTRTILVAGGYGYGNAGDEAQCAETLRLLQARYPDYQIENLSPNPDYSARMHPLFHHVFASRVSVYNQHRRHDWYRLSGALRKLGFLCVSILMYLNAPLVRRGWPTLLLSARRAAFLQRLLEAALFYYCGGGYLTGATQSRLWEAFLTCAVCRRFHIPVVMSGQTIGLWSGPVERRFARWAFRDVAVIGLRDNEASARDLQAIGIGGSRVMPTHDDALFCEKSAERQVFHERYLTVNFHFWGMKGSARGMVLEKIHQAMESFRRQFSVAKVVFVPMHVSDLKSYYAYQGIYADPDLEVLECNSDFRRIRRAIADSTALLTMKHHPIIFAIGEGVPVISLAYSKYYVHKNFGALQQYGVERLIVDLQDAAWQERLQSALASAGDRAWYSAIVADHVAAARRRKETFLKCVDGILLNVERGQI